MSSPFVQQKLLWPPPSIHVEEGDRINLLRLLKKTKEESENHDKDYDVSGFLRVTTGKVLFPSTRYPDLSKTVQQELFNDIQSSFQEQGFNVSTKEWAKVEDKEESDRNTPRMRIKCTEKGCKVQFQFNWDEINNYWFIKCGYGNFDHNHGPKKQRLEPNNYYCEEPQEERLNPFDQSKAILATEKPSPVSVLDNREDSTERKVYVGSALEAFNLLKEFTSKLSLDGMSNSGTKDACDMSLSSDVGQSTTSAFSGRASSMHTSTIRETIGTFPASAPSATASLTIFEDDPCSGQCCMHSEAVRWEEPPICPSAPQTVTIPGDTSEPHATSESEITLSGSTVGQRADLGMTGGDPSDVIAKTAEPPHPPQLLGIAQSLMRSLSGNLAEGSSELGNLCRKIDDNARWCQHRNQEAPAFSANLIVETLLDGTRALAEIHHKCPPCSSDSIAILDPSFSGLVSEAWSTVGAAWRSSVPELEPENTELAQELFQTYQRVYPYGWVAMETTVMAQNWPAMIRVRQEAHNALPKADPTKIHIHQQVLDSFERTSQGNDAYDMYHGECILMVQAFVESDRSGEYMDLAIMQYCELWNLSMLEPSPTHAWSINLVSNFGPERNERQAKLSSILGLATDQNIEQTKRCALRLVFRTLEMNFQYAFEDAVDPDHKLGLNHHRV